MGKVRIVIKHNPHKLHKAHDPITVDEIKDTIVFIAIIICLIAFSIYIVILFIQFLIGLF